MAAMYILAIILFLALIITLLTVFRGRGFVSDNVLNGIIGRKKSNFKKKTGVKSLNKGIPAETYLKAHDFLVSNFITKKSYLKNLRQVNAMGIYSATDVRVFSSKYYLSSVLIAFLVIFAGIVIYRDLLTSVLFVLMGYVIKTSLVEKKLEREYSKILFAFSDMISNVRHEYSRTNSVLDSLKDCEVDKCLQIQIDEIINILEGEKAEERLEYFFNTSPLRLLQTFAGICYIVNNSGDTQLPDGSSNFLTSLTYISNETNLEIRKINLINLKFKGLLFLPIIPLFAVGLLEGVMVKMLPGLGLLYKGFYGYVARILCIAVSIICYSLILNANKITTVINDDRNEIALSLYKQPVFRKIARVFIPKKRSSILKKEKLLKESLTKNNMDMLYINKVVSLIMVTVVSFLVFSLAVVYDKEFNTKNLIPVGLTYIDEFNEEEQDKLRGIDDKFIYSKDMTEQDLWMMYKNELNLTDRQIEEQIARIQDKKERVLGAEITVLHLWGAIIIGLFAYMMPDLKLFYRKKMIKIESEDDCLQMQTTIAMLMNTSVDTMDLLDWLVKTSRVHKDLLIDAYHDYASDPEGALGYLKYKSDSGEMRRMVDRLRTTVHQISIAEAFSDLGQEKDHILRMREAAQENSINNKRSFMSPIALFSMYSTIVMFLIVPIVVMAATEMMKMLESGILG